MTVEGGGGKSITHQLFALPRLAWLILLLLAGPTLFLLEAQPAVQGPQVFIIIIWGIREQGQELGWLPQIGEGTIGGTLHYSSCVLDS